MDSGFSGNRISLQGCRYDNGSASICLEETLIRVNFFTQHAVKNLELNDKHEEVGEGILEKIS